MYATFHADKLHCEAEKCREMDEDQIALQECIQNNIWKYLSSWATQKYYFMQGFLSLSASSLAFSPMENLIPSFPSHSVFPDCFRRPSQPAQQQANRAGCAGAIYSSTLEICIHKYMYKCPMLDVARINNKRLQLLPSSFFPSPKCLSNFQSRVSSGPPRVMQGPIFLQFFCLLIPAIWL